MYSQSKLTNSKRRFKRRLKTIIGLDHSIDAELNLEKKRLGTIYGGWWVATAPLNIVRFPVVLSFGIGQDISFDREIVEIFNAKVYAFDPTPLSLNWLARQTDLPQAFEAHPYGVAGFDGNIKLGMPSRVDWDDFSVLRAGHGETITCPVKRISTICQDLNIDQIDVLKLDVEGAEYDVLPDLLASNIRPRQILVEYHYFDRAGVRDTRASISALQDAGYGILDVSPWGRELTLVLN